jgi:hypothetical protein
MMIRITIVSISILVNVAAAAQTTRLRFDPLWRDATDADLGSSSDRKWREETPSRFLSATGDFNGDGIPDLARLKVSRKGTGYALVVELSQKPGVFETIKLAEFPMADFPATGIKRVPPGDYPTACAKGYDCADDEPKYVHPKHDAIDFFKRDSANRYYYWSDSKQAFVEVRMNG